MKIAHILSGIFLALCLSGCGTLKSTPSSDADVLIERAVHNQEFSMVVTRIMPQRGSMRTDLGYFIQVKDGEVDSNLPYFGTSHLLTYSTSNPLNFRGPIDAYNCYQESNGAYIFEFLVTNTDNPRIKVHYHLTVWDNASASLTVNSSGRQAMSFTGYLTDGW